MIHATGTRIGPLEGFYLSDMAVHSEVKLAELFFSVVAIFIYHDIMRRLYSSQSAVEKAICYRLCVLRWDVDGSALAFCARETLSAFFILPHRALASASQTWIAA
jgi:hypothetical protein